MKCVTSTSFFIAINGENYGFFKGGRGLRQGDPVSPYLFTLVIEILNLLMIRKVANSEFFQYHFGCKQLKITHACFNDDLLMFYHGDSDSVRIIKEIIDEFGNVSRLLPNCNKSTTIFGSVSKEDRRSILEVYPFRVEHLPVKYLGVPLITKIIGVKDCKGFIDKSGQANGKAKVAWKKMCMPKAKGGDGSKTSLWFDSWSSLGALIEIVSFRDLYDAMMEITLTLKEFYHKYYGQWPEESDGALGKFSGNLTTQDKIRNWGTYDMLACPLCVVDMDSHNHLFFNCDYTRTYWQMVKRQIVVQKVTSADTEVSVSADDSVPGQRDEIDQSDVARDDDFVSPGWIEVILMLGMRRPSWNKSQAIQQVIMLKALLERVPECDDVSRKLHNAHRKHQTLTTPPILMLLFQIKSKRKAESSACASLDAHLSQSQNQNEQTTRSSACSPPPIRSPNTPNRYS
uniref:RNA-directed DNA polymerase, eukaryota, reverse transcriptase zinc-binding domain protein n=1 Tax=Tanacetum cinerariifolium TaxID=118510 RepID=A0A6L2NCF3_TANCI|nr:RNA-directed DNA polymerase, eukaryota, reverse transcriptase zinc-binding domain protein [Tanacetum cinerariifolium]